MTSPDPGAEVTALAAHLRDHHDQIIHGHEETDARFVQALHRILIAFPEELHPDCGKHLPGEEGTRLTRYAERVHVLKLVIAEQRQRIARAEAAVAALTVQVRMAEQSGATVTALLDAEAGDPAPGADEDPGPDGAS